MNKFAFLRSEEGKVSFPLPRALQIHAFLFFTLWCVLPGAFSQSCDDPSVDTLNLVFTTPQGDTAVHSVYFKGVTYDTANCRSTWSYCINNGGTPDISHYSIGGDSSFLACIDSSHLISVTSSDSLCVGVIACDTSGGGGTGICGIKFDCAADSCVCFSFTISGMFAVGEIYAGIKAATQSQSGAIAGPDCSSQATVTCDDGDPCTVNDTLDVNCNCAGTFVDMDSDGVCAALDCNDSDSTITGAIGSSCDDGDACTVNDTLDVNCNCAGTFVDMDNDGVCAALDCNDSDSTITGAIGSSCDDGDLCTVNDTLDVNCNCAGTFVDMDNDGLCAALDCNDSDSTVTDTIPNCCMFNPFPDCDGDGIADSLEPDCDSDGIPDDCEEDRNGNNIPDECEPDCDGDGIPDASEPDCDGDGIPNDCELSNNDCDHDGYPDDCEPDCDGDGIPNHCEADCDGDGLPDDCEADCDGNGIPDDCENLADCDNDGIPDSMEPDDDADSVPNDCDLCAGHDDHLDDDGDGVPDGCDLCPGHDDNKDDDGDGIPDGCDNACDIKCHECIMESGFGSEVSISFCCLSVTLDKWVSRKGNPGVYVGFEIVSASANGQPVDPADVGFIVKAGSKCYEAKGPVWVNPNGTSGPKVKPINHITFCENTALCGAPPLYCDNSCKEFTSSDDQMYLTVQPNPTMKNIIAHFNLNKAEEVTIDVLSVNGKTVKSQIETGKKGDNTVLLNISDMHPGLYHILIKASDGVRIERFVKVTD